MKLTVLGSGSGLTKERFPVAYLIENKHPVVFDLGFGCFKQLQKVIDPLEIHNLFFSHYSHPDHIIDLVSFLQHRKLSANKHQLNLFGPVGFKEFFPKIPAMFEWFEELPFKVSVQELNYASTKLFDFSIKTKPVKHLDSKAIGFRIQCKGKTITYSGDTEYCQEIIDLAKEADLLILECSSLKKIPGHLTPEECLKIARLANAKKLLLSHLYPETEKINLNALKNENDFSGEISLAEDLMQIKI